MMRSKVAAIIAICGILTAITYITQTPVAKAEPAALTYDCEGDACGQVTVTWDESKQQYKVQNNSTDRWVRVDAANLGATATICVAAGKTEYLPLKSIVGAYRANYERTCANQE